MVTARLLTVAVLATTVCASSASQDIARDKDGGKKDKGNEMEDMFTAFMMMKNIVSMMLMFVSPIIQIKGFGLSVLNTLINIGRFIMQMQATKRLNEMASQGHARPDLLPHVFHAGQKTFMDHHENHRHIHHNDHPENHQHENHHHENHHDDHEGYGTSVYIIKDSASASGHDDGSDHISSWIDKPYDLWSENQENPHYSSGQEQQWSPSQKVAYYASPSANLLLSRLGVSQTQTTASYQPFYTHNLTRLR